MTAQGIADALGEGTEADTAIKAALIAAMVIDPAFDAPITLGAGRDLSLGTGGQLVKADASQTEPMLVVSSGADDGVYPTVSGGGITHNGSATITADNLRFSVTNKLLNMSGAGAGLQFGNTGSSPPWPTRDITSANQNGGSCGARIQATSAPVGNLLAQPVTAAGVWHLFLNDSDESVTIDFGVGVTINGSRTMVLTARQMAIVVYVSATDGQAIVG